MEEEPLLLGTAISTNQEYEHSEKESVSYWLFLVNCSRKQCFERVGYVAELNFLFSL